MSIGAWLVRCMHGPAPIANGLTRGLDVASRIAHADGTAAFARLCGGGDAGLPADVTPPHMVDRWELAQLPVHLGLQLALESGHGGVSIWRWPTRAYSNGTALGLATGEELPAGFKGALRVP
jgi:hypothetical protein